jgi:hypothetical protein
VDAGARAWRCLPPGTIQEASKCGQAYRPRMVHRGRRQRVGRRRLATNFCLPRVSEVPPVLHSTTEHLSRATEHLSRVGCTVLSSSRRRRSSGSPRRMLRTKECRYLSHHREHHSESRRRHLPSTARRQSKRQRCSSGRRPGRQPSTAGCRRRNRQRGEDRPRTRCSGAEQMVRPGRPWRLVQELGLSWRQVQGRNRPPPEYRALRRNRPAGSSLPVR